MCNVDTYYEKEVGSIRTPLGDLKVTAMHQDDEYYDLYIDLERWVDGEKRLMQVCVVTVNTGTVLDEPASMHIYPYNTTDKVTDDCDDDLVVRTGDDRCWY